MKLKQPLGKIIAFVFFLLFGASSFAASVSQVKGNKALLQLQGLGIQPGTELYAINSEQKRKALLRVTQVKGDQAVADIVQGTAAAGMMIIIKASAGAPPTAAQPYGSGGSYAGNRYGQPAKTYKKGYGVLAGVAMSTMSVTVKTNTNPTGENLSLKGTSFNAKGFFDYDLSKMFTIRGAAGLETLNVSGTSANDAFGNNSCSNASGCTLAINYLDLEAQAQLNLMNDKHRLWIGAGFEFLMAMSKGNNISNLEANSTNQLVTLGAGFDLRLSNTMYIPLVAEYGLFPFAGINLSALYFRGGIGWRF